MNRNWRHHLVLITILSLLVCRTATAHDALASWTIARVTPEALNVEVNIAADSAWSAVQRTVSPGTEFIAEQFESVGRPRLIAFARTLQVVTVDGNRVEPSAVDATMDFDDFDLRLTYPLPPGAQRLEIREPYLKFMSGNYRSHLTVLDESGGTLAGGLLDAADPLMVVNLSNDAPPVVETRSGGLTRYFWLGVEHILTGYDHLLFLAGLLVMCARVRSMLIIISSFTVAHSLTLGLASLNIVSLPNRWTEAAIAASIVYVGIENLVRRGEPRGRWVLTFVFGLIHGFGFANMLREVGLGANGASIVGPLLAFNAGIELGQIAVALIVLPVWWRLQKRWEPVRQFRPAVSVLIVLAGAWWLLQRLLPR